MMSEVILVEDDEHVRAAYAQALELKGINVSIMPSAAGVIERIGRRWPGIIITDIRMPGTDGLELMALALEIDPELPVILITGHGDVPMAVQAMRDGAYDFLQKPFPPDILTDAVRRALEKRRLTIENRELRARLTDAGPLEQSIVGRSAGMVRLRDLIRNFAETDADVLIIGETGAGKECVARSLHDLSSRSAGRFVPINCGALPQNIIESELFGHEAGAFTGATKQRIGRIEHAMGGTLFLDEIESMPMDLQVKMLRVLEERKIVRLGSNEEIPIDVRVMAATKEDLREAAAQGHFREDLYYRLNVLSLAIPPLRDRRDDILLLFHHFSTQNAVPSRGMPRDVEPETLAALLAHDWPGNVRELKNAAIRYNLGLELDLSQSGGSGQMPEDRGQPAGWLNQQVATFESQIIQRMLRQNAGSLKQTYEALGISRKTLYDKMQKYGIAAGKDA
jgi:two-component system C4-dicarboxylate transport response regulator DctD